MKKIIAILLFTLLLSYCFEQPIGQPQAPLFNNVNTSHFAITTQSPKAQRYFDQGLSLSYGLNHEEAVRSFREAVRLDPSCAMCYWGCAYALTANLSKPMINSELEAANKAITKAFQLLKSKHKPYTDLEKQLIQALVQRYPKQSIENRMAFDKIYANAMREVWQYFPNNETVGVLFAKALLEINPNDYWRANGLPLPITTEIIDVLEESLVLSPKHLGANHLYVYILHNSSQSVKALASADTLYHLLPQLGHFLHLSSHIYLQQGEYTKAITFAKKLRESNKLYHKQCYAQGTKTFTQTIDYQKVILAAATLGGDKKLAIATAKQLVQYKQGQADDTLNLYKNTLLNYTLVKFEKWNKILSQPLQYHHPYETAIAHYARGMAFVGKKQLDNAQQEQQELLYCLNSDILKNSHLWTQTPTVQLPIQIANLILTAKIAQQKGEITTAINQLETALTLEEPLRKLDITEWFCPVRHVLGELLLETEQFAAAEQIYRQDLQQYPKNDWAQNGLEQSLELQQKTSNTQTALGVQE